MKICEVIDLVCEETRIAVLEYSDGDFATLHDGVACEVPMHLLGAEIKYLAPAVDASTGEALLVVQKKGEI